MIMLRVEGSADLESGDRGKTNLQVAMNPPSVTTRGDQGKTHLQVAMNPLSDTTRGEAADPSREEILMTIVAELQESTRIKTTLKSFPDVTARKIEILGGVANPKGVKKRKISAEMTKERFQNTIIAVVVTMIMMIQIFEEAQ